MIVRDLIKLLIQLDQEAEVYMSSDSEGNSFGDVQEYAVATSNNKKIILLYPNDNYLSEELIDER